MRTTISCIAMATIIVLATSCKNQPSVPGAGVAVIDSTHTLDSLISSVLYKASIAKQNIALYDSICNNTFVGIKPVANKSYTIRAIDLLLAMGISGKYADSALCKYKYARAIIGYDRVAGYQLFLVPVVGANLKIPIAGSNVYLDSLGNGINPISTKNSTGNEYVLDLNAPCPNTCGSDDAVLTADHKKP